MATVTKPQQPAKPVQRPTPARPVAKTASNKAPRGNQVILFDRTNYMWMIGGVLLILIGLAIMSGGKSADPHQFLYDEIYSFRRITLAPIIVLLGFAIEVHAIMRKPKEA